MTQSVTDCIPTRSVGTIMVEKIAKKGGLNAEIVDVMISGVAA